ncbi:MAG: C25 family cysteine peptidase, partial [Flavisolibacter sp.]
MKKSLLALLIVCGFISKAQVYNNEWIDYSKTYYKFKVGKNGVYRIFQSVLSSAGLGSTPVEYFQLWRNGSQIPIYTSIPTGTLSNTDYIEFWGEMNDGRPDKELYRDPSYQLNAKWSLETDTAAYFLTANQNISTNLRLSSTPNNVAGNTLPTEPYFMYTLGKYFNDQINPGNAVNVGDYMYSSSYDKGEGFTSNNIALNGSLSYSFPDPLNVYASGPAPKFKIAVAGNAINARRYNVKINSDSIVGNEVDFFNFSVDSSTFNLSTLASNSATVNISNLTQCITPPDCPVYDAFVVAQFEITYPRKFDFGGKTNFEFNLPANPSGNFLQITNFSYGSVPPVLYDLSNGATYVADMTAAPMLQFVLQPSAVDRRLILVSEDPALINNVTSMQTRNFVNYTAAPYQGDYIIISNPIIYGSGGSNPVDDYRQYRSSAAGGGFNAKVYDINEIIDQFGFGIKQSSAALRDFIYYARTKYAVSPKFIFIIGKGVNYMHERWYETNPAISLLNIVPSFGWPSSDILLTADQGSSYPTVPIGRLSAINSSDVALYLKKVKDYEQAQATGSPYIQDKAWMKNVVHMVGTSDGLLKTLLDEYMNNYRDIIIDTLFGAKVTTFSKNTVSDVEQINSTALQNLFTQGISLITYFGHSSSTTLEFNLDNPANYNNFAKYPMFVGLGCNAGNFFNFNLTRLQTNETISEKYVLAPDRGTIGFIASTHFGIVHYLDIWSNRFYNEITNTSYGKTIGEQMKIAAEDVFGFTSQDDFYARCNVEETELHGDPAIRLNNFKKPDYVIEDSMLKVTPDFISVGDRTFKVKASFINMGRAVNKNIVVEVKRTYPNKSIAVVARDTIPGIRFMDSVTFNIPINPIRDKGINKITVTVDADNVVDELYETNNS